MWGVRTKRVTAFDQPALGGVCKLAATREPPGPWIHRVKLSEQAIKVSTPGIQQVRRFTRGGREDHHQRGVAGGALELNDPAALHVCAQPSLFPRVRRARIRPHLADARLVDPVRREHLNPQRRDRAVVR